MSEAAIATREEMLEHLVAFCWPHQALEGDPRGAMARAEAAWERLLRNGLPSVRAADGSQRFDPIAVNHALVARAGAPCDEAWDAWRASARRNFTALEGGPHRLRFRLRREWHQLPKGHSRPLLLRLPLPLRETIRDLRVQLLEPAESLVSQRAEAGRIELRVSPDAAARGPVAAELSFELVAASTLDLSSPLAAPDEVASKDSLWLERREGQIVCTPTIEALAARLAQGCADVAAFALAVWEEVFASLCFGELDRASLDPADPLASLLRQGWTDCALGAALVCALCRARAIPARMVHGYLLAPGVPGMHSWAEARFAPGRWAPIDFAAWTACAGDARDPLWGKLFFGRINPRLTCEIAPRQFTGWGSARPPERWVKLHRLVEGGLEQSLRALPGGELFMRDRVWCETI